MRIVVFSSGSSGNATLIQTNKANILVDCGLTKKTINENLSKYDLSLLDINYLFITHEHIDHVKSFAQMLKMNNIKIYISKGTLNAIYAQYYKDNKNNDCDEINERLKNNSITVIERIPDSILYPEYVVDDFRVQVLPTFHDAEEPIGFTFASDDKKICYITDTGYVHKDLKDYIYNCDCYILESNHDPEMLLHSSRPYQLKLRILSDHGHLSNEDSMVTLANIMGEKTKLVMHAHVSEECNLSPIIEMTRKRVLEGYGIKRDDITYVILSRRPSGEYII